MVKRDLVLLVLNPSSMLDLMERALRAAGFDVAVANAVSAMNKSVDESIPSLIIIGENLGGLDGFSISSELLERFPTLPIILYTDHDTTGFAKSVLRFGLSGYLYPPLKMDDIVDEVKRCLIRARKLGDWLRSEVKRTTSSLAEKAKMSEAERSKLEAIIANIQDGVIILDEGHRVLFANQSVREIFQIEGMDISGRVIEDVVSNMDVKALIVRFADGPLKYHEVNFDDGRVFNAQYTPIPNIGAAVTMQDISYLKELDRLKNDFIHTVSHDLRSPLTAVLGYTELIERTGTLNDSQQEFMRRLRGSIEHITQLINDLLDLGRLEAGFDTRREMIQLDDILKYSLDMFDTEVKKKRIRLVSRISTDLLPMRANPIRIRQMIDNLLGNAIKYTPDDGMVGVEMFMEEKQIILKVEDTGPGIPPEEQGRIFEKFFRAANVSDSVQGTGLGLAIVRSIVESHQGRVWVESAMGKGSAFIVLLPAQD
jgi:signal transduction histidine kinase